MIKYLRTEDEIWDNIRKGEHVKYARLVETRRYKPGVFNVADLDALIDNLKHLDTTIFFVEVNDDGTN